MADMKTKEAEMFDALKEIDNIVDWIRDWFKENGPEANAVIGLSGGKDSTIVAALLVKALGKDRVVGVLMPNGIQKDISDSKEVAEFLGIRNYTVNIEGAYNAALASFEEGFPEVPVSNDTKINLAPRLRMATLYALAQSLPGGGRVTNTCNASEDYIGYSTKYGDAAGDFSPCSDFTVTEMLMIGDALGLPEKLVHKTPSDGLCGQTDEDKLGFTYAALDKYILTGECPDEELKKRIDMLHKLNLHKLKVIPAYKREA